MLAKIKKVKFEPEYKNPIYKVILACPSFRSLFFRPMLMVGQYFLQALRYKVN